jgi:hypothetical protein
VFCITNLIKGTDKNKEFFLNQGSTMKYLKFILESEDLKFIDLCVKGLKEIASLNTTLIRIIKSEDLS